MVIVKHYLLCVICCAGVLLLSAWDAGAVSAITVKVEVVKAHRESDKVDPQIQDMVQELGPVFSYTGFTLLEKTEKRLTVKARTEILLSKTRVLELSFLEFKQGQARIQVRILENKTETFKTVLLMVDKGSALIGGPPHEGGVLLLRIGAEFGE